VEFSLRQNPTSGLGQGLSRIWFKSYLFNKTMTNSSLKPSYPTAVLTGKAAFKDEQMFAAWSEAVKQQMLAALQKRQKLS